MSLRLFFFFFFELFLFFGAKTWQNHRMAEVERCLWRSSIQIPWFKVGTARAGCRRGCEACPGVGKVLRRPAVPAKKCLSTKKDSIAFFIEITFFCDWRCKEIKFIFILKNGNREKIKEKYWRLFKLDYFHIDQNSFFIIQEMLSIVFDLLELLLFPAQGVSQLTQTWKALNR